MRLQPVIKLFVGGACLFTGASLGAAFGAGTYAIIANGIASVTAGNVANAIDALTNGNREDISLENQDLIKAIGRAIGKIITDIANNKFYQNYKTNLLKIAKNAEKNWLIIAEKSDLSSDDVPSYIQQNFYDIQESPLDLEEWKDIFIRLNLKTFPNGGADFPAELITDIAKILQQVFPHALTEVLKYDFVHDGKAYAGLTLRLLTDIKASLDFSRNGEILVKLEELIIGLQQNPEEVFREISEQIEVGFTTVIDKLDTVEEKIDYIIEKLEHPQMSGDNLEVIKGKKITEAQWSKAYGISRTEFNNRRSLLAKVNQEVKDRLNQSLHHRVLIDLGKEKQPQQVERIWDVEVKVGNNPMVKLPKETSILDIFDDESIAGRLLILGAPGGGKTTTLLQLAEGLIERAEYDVICPIPIILELSSWKPIKTGLPWDRKEKDLTIAEWIERELLSSKYADLPLDSNVIKKWIKAGEILPLFDGLDELPAERQEKCVQAINQFKCLQMVVCSRKEEYEVYESNLRLNGAICLENLEQQQIHEYLERVNLSELWESIKDSSVILELISKPLFLTIMTLGYSQINIEEWKGCNTQERCADYLLGVYVREMFRRKIRTEQYYNASKILDILKLLAQSNSSGSALTHLNYHNKKYKKCYTFLNYIFRLFNFITWLISFTLGLFVLSPFMDKIINTENNLSQALFSLSTITISAFFLVSGCSSALFSDISATISINSKLTTSKKTFYFNYDIIESIVINCLIYGFLGLLFGLYFGFLLSKIGFYFWGVVVFLIYICIYFGVAYVIIENNNKNHNNLFDDLICITMLLIFCLIFGVSVGKTYGLIICLLLGIFFVYCCNLIFLEFIVSNIFFFFLKCNDEIPWNIDRFLDYCTERMMLQRVGKSYRFIHRLLQEHFANMEIEHFKN